MGGGDDAFVTKLNPTGSALVYSTYLGGTGDDGGRASRWTPPATPTSPATPVPPTSPPPPAPSRPVSAAALDAFVTKLNATGSALGLLHLPGRQFDDSAATGIALDASGNAYVTGVTASTNFPTTPGAFQTTNGGGSDAFVTKLNPTGSALVYSTYLGGNSNDPGGGIAVDASGNAYVTGYTSSTNFPTTPGAYQTTNGGGRCLRPQISSCEADTWTTIAPMPNIPVNTATASGVAFGGKFYVIDSGAGYGVPLPLKVYDPVADSWSLKAVDPVLRGESAAGVINNKIYVAEGWDGQYGSDSNAATTALEIYDPATDSWTAGAPSLIARGLSATAVIGGKLYVAGGTAAGYANFANLEIYDPLTDSWSMGAPLPTELTQAGGAAFGGKFYVFGGYTGPSVYNQQITGSVQIYDPVLNTWSTGTPMPTPRAVMVVGVINGKIYIAGGNNSSGNTDSSVVVYDPITDSWSAAADEPTPRGQRSCGCSGR